MRERARIARLDIDTIPRSVAAADRAKYRAAKVARNDAFLRRSQSGINVPRTLSGRIVKSNSESNRAESEGPGEARALSSRASRPSVRSAPRRENAGCWPLHLAYMYVLCQRAFCICAVATSSPLARVPLSLLLFPTPLPFHPPFLFAYPRLFFSLNPVVLLSLYPVSFALSIFSFSSTRASQIRETSRVRAESTNSEKRTLAPKKGRIRRRREGKRRLQCTAGMLNRSLVEINKRSVRAAERNIKQHRVQAAIVARR